MRTKHNFGDRAFSVDGPRAWNHQSNQIKTKAINVRQNDDHACRELVKLSVDRPQTPGHVTQPFQTVTGDIVIWAVRPKRSVNPPPTP